MRVKVSKVLLALLTAICFACFAYAGPGVYAEGEEEPEVVAENAEDFVNQLKDGEIYISGLASGDYTKVIIPEKIDGKPVTKINAQAFMNKNKIKEVIIPDSVRSIGAQAFYGCNQMTDITIPVDTEYASNTFYYCGSISTINFTPGENGIMIDSNESAYSEGTGVWFSDTVAYQAGNLTTVNFSDGIKHIGANSIRSRGKLTTVNLPNNEFTVGYAAFFDDYKASFDKKDILNITEFGQHSFSNCGGLEELSFNGKIKEIPYRAFYNCKEIKKLTIPDTVETIDREAFRYCTNIEEVTIPVDTIYADNTFYNNDSIKTINYTPGRTGIMWEASDSGYSVENGIWFSNTIAYQAAKLETVNFIGEITHIGANSVRNNKETFTTVNFPDNEFTVGYAAFYTDKYAVIDSDAVSRATSIGQYAFYECAGLDDLKFNDQITEIPYRAFYNCRGIKKLTIPDTVETIDREAFRYCTNIEEVTIPVDTIYADNTFYNNDSIKTINYTPGRTGIMWEASDSGYSAENGIWYSNTIAYQAAKLETVNFIGEITHIGANSVRNNKETFTTVNLPQNEFTVGYAAFYQDTHLSVNGEELANATEIGEYAFQQCLGMKDLNINKKVTNIGKNAFNGCTEINTLTIPDSVTDIGQNAFAGCANLTEISIPIDVNYSDNTFSEYNSVTKVVYTKGTYGNSKNSEGHNNSYSLQKKTDNNETVIFADGVEYIDSAMFNDNCNKSIKNIKFPKSLKGIGANAFVKGIDAVFYGYKGTAAETYVNSAEDDTLSFRPLEYPIFTEQADETELGKEEQFDAFVYTDIDTESKEIKWSVKDANSKKTVIKDGKLTVGNNEKAAEIKVCATYGDNTVEVPVKINRTVKIVEFDALDGTSTEEAIATDADGKIAELPTATYDNFTFDGWFTAKEGGDKVIADTVFDEDTVVYAQYSLTPVDSVDIKAGSQPKSGVALDTSVASIGDSVDADSVKVSYSADGKDAVGEAKCVTTYAINVSFKLKNGFTITEKSAVKLNGATVKASAADGVYTVSTEFAATTHGETVLKYAKEATKTEEGYSGDKCCSICNEVLEKGKTIPKLPEDSKDTKASEDGYVDASTLKSDMIKTGLLVSDKKTGGKYKITKVTKKKGKISGGYVTYMMPYNKDSKTAAVKDTVTLGGVKFKVNVINSKAFAGCAKLTKVTIGKNVTKIGASAFKGDAKLKNIIFKGTKVKKMGSNAFKGIYKKPKFKAPKKVVKKYKKMIKKAKAPKKFKISK